ncbi:MAG: RluA family pseudouridine synthase [Candidatus Izimaplasma sp.]|nr:RluA family pseudouridine synthase [Candidatus Izimaplasma bacterium]
MAKKIEFVIEKKQRKIRIDKFLAKKTPHSRSTIQSLIADNHILVNSEPTKASYNVKTTDHITLEDYDEEESSLLKEDIPLDIVYEDDEIIVVNKPTGLVVHPGAGNPSGTLVNGLLYNIKDFKAIKGEIRPGIVHRIDKDTSGLLVVAKTPAALEHLSDQFKAKTTTRSYIALTEGVIDHNKGKINAPIGRNPKRRKQMAVVKDGKEAVTHFQVTKRYKKNTLIKCQLETGRTHQIRVHMQYIKHPLVGDPTYGHRKTVKSHGQFLHAETLGFIHPKTHKKMTFEQPLPTYFTQYLETLE